MSKDISKGLLDRLIQIGRDEQFADLQGIGVELPGAKNGQFMRLHSDSWTQVAKELSGEEAVCLIKSLTKLERHPHFQAGSVSPVIWIFRSIHAEQSDDLIDWILANTDNPYIPFGTTNHRAKSLEEYHRLCGNDSAQRVFRKGAELDRQVDANSRKAAEASQLLFNAVRRKDKNAISALLARGADSSMLDASGQTALQAAQTVGLGYLFDTEEP